MWAWWPPCTWLDKIGLLRISMALCIPVIRLLPFMHIYMQKPNCLWKNANFPWTLCGEWHDEGQPANVASKQKNAVLFTLVFNTLRSKDMNCTADKMHLKTIGILLLIHWWNNRFAAVIRYLQKNLGSQLSSNRDWEGSLELSTALVPNVSNCKMWMIPWTLEIPTTRMSISNTISLVLFASERYLGIKGI